MNQPDSKITALNNSLFQLIKLVSKAVQDQNDSRVILHHGYYKSLKIENKTHALNFILNSSDLNFEIMSVSEVISVWSELCKKEINNFIMLFLEANGTIEDDDLWFIFDWLEEEYHQAFGTPPNVAIKLRDALLNMENIMTEWTKTQVQESKGSNPVYLLTKAERRMLKLIINHDKKKFMEISDEDFEKYLKRTREFVLQNYNMEDVWKAKRYIDYFWARYHQ